MLAALSTETCSEVQDLFFVSSDGSERVSYGCVIGIAGNTILLRCTMLDGRKGVSAMDCCDHLATPITSPGTCGMCP